MEPVEDEEEEDEEELDEPESKPIPTTPTVIREFSTQVMGRSTQSQSKIPAVYHQAAAPELYL